MAHVLNYASLTSSYSDVFGEENVGVFLYEELAADPESFALRLCRFMNVSEQDFPMIDATREQSRLTRIQYLRVKYNIAPSIKLSGFVPRRVNQALQIIGGGSVRASPSPEWKSRIENLYRESNRKVAKKYNLPLQLYGYSM